MLDIDDSTLQQIMTGKTVSTLVPTAERGVVELLAWVSFGAAPEAVWAVLDDCDNYVHTMPRVKLSKVLERRPDGLTLRIIIDTPFPLPDLESIYESVHTSENGLWTRAWKQVDTGFMPNSGSWKLAELPGSPGRTLAQYRVRFEPKIPLPKRVVHFAHNRVLPELFQCIETHAKKV